MTNYEITNMTSRLFLLILISLFVLSCSSKAKQTEKKLDDPVENIVNYVTSTRDNLMIELPYLYDTLTNHIAEESAERFILVEKLKKKDFKIIDWGRGNYPPLGSRIISIVMKKGNCFCQVDKIYYKTIVDSLFQMTERIRCSDSLTFYNVEINKDKK